MNPDSLPPLPGAIPPLPPVPPPQNSRGSAAKMPLPSVRANDSWSPPPVSLPPAEESRPPIAPAWTPPTIEKPNLGESIGTERRSTPDRFSQTTSEPKGNQRIGAGKIIVFAVAAIVLTAGGWFWSTRNTPKPWLDVWISTPQEAKVSADIVSQIEKLLPSGDEAKVALSNLVLEHRRGQANGKWSATAKVSLTQARYEPADWAAALQKTGFDADEFSKALAACDALDSNKTPRKPDNIHRQLAAEIAPSGETLEIALGGSVFLQGQDWPVSVDDLAAIQARIAPLLKGRCLKQMGGDAMPMDSVEARSALAKYIEERQAFVKEVNAAVQQETESQKRKQEEKKAEDQLTAAGLAQASWYALEKLSGFLVNTGINQRLIELARQQGDVSKVALYASYEETNRQNIQDTATAYAQSIKDLARLPLAVRQKAVEDIQRQIAAQMGSAWRAGLAAHMASDARNLPDFQETIWLDEILQIRQQK